MKILLNLAKNQWRLEFKGFHFLCSVLPFLQLMIIENAEWNTTLEADGTHRRSVKYDPLKSHMSLSYFRPIQCMLISNIRF
jgi:hypothetical protein